MVQFDITTMSSKGQIVIPLEMRKNFKKGEKLTILSDGERLVLKKASKMDKNLEEDLEFAKRTEAAWKRYELGKFKEMDRSDFLKALEKL